MKCDFSKEERALLSMLATALTDNRSIGKTEQPDVDKMHLQEQPDVDKLLALAKVHKVLPLAYNELMKLPLSMEQEALVQATTKTVVAQNLRLLFLDKYVTTLLAARGIAVAVLKGMVTAGCYMEPLYRKSGDIDLLLLDRSKLTLAKEALCEAGFVVAKHQPSLHHIVFDSAEGIELELHTEIAEPFDNKDMNQYMTEVMQRYGKKTVQETVCGVSLPALCFEYHAFELLLHMLQHFLRAGFGIKLLCDWVVFWNRRTVEREQQEAYVKLVTACGLKRFSDQITSLCIDYLGLLEERVLFMELDAMESDAFLREILDAEEFGKSSKDRMVALRGGRLTDYVREFHHQMRLNYPRAGRCFLLWPFLWVLTLVRFLRNNSRLKRPSVKAIMKKAGERGRMLESLKLFQVNKN